MGLGGGTKRHAHSYDRQAHVYQGTTFTHIRLRLMLNVRQQQRQQQQQLGHTQGTCHHVAHATHVLRPVLVVVEFIVRVTRCTSPSGVKKAGGQVLGVYGPTIDVSHGPHGGHGAERATWEARQARPQGSCPATNLERDGLSRTPVGREGEYGAVVSPTLHVPYSLSHLGGPLHPRAAAHSCAHPRPLSLLARTLSGKGRTRAGSGGVGDRTAPPGRLPRPRPALSRRADAREVANVGCDIEREGPSEAQRHENFANDTGNMTKHKRIKCALQLLIPYLLFVLPLPILLLTMIGHGDMLGAALCVSGMAL